MSRVGKIPVAVPSEVIVSILPELVIVEGPKGKLQEAYTAKVKIEIQECKLLVISADISKESNAAQGLYRNLIQNIVTGVSIGFSKNLIITGVGYRVEVKKDLLLLIVGYSSEFNVVIPEGVSVIADAQGKITISGINKQRIGEFSAQIRNIRIPEPYKGKGVRYETEVIRYKIGKSGVK
jgi:large subunit ribosomal protein L6